MTKRKAKTKQKTTADLFLELARPDKDGFSRIVPVSEFVGEYSRLVMGNGAGWCRADSGLAKKYNVILHKDGRGNTNTAVELHGFNKQPKKKPVPSRIKKELKSESCRVLAIGNVEIDHKDGHKDDYREASEFTADDFQPLAKGPNNAKKQHCKECRKTKKRFDATRLGYSKAQIKGDGTYRGTCVGCYWYDPFEFNRVISKNFS